MFLEGNDKGIHAPDMSMALVNSPTHNSMEMERWGNNPWDVEKAVRVSLKFIAKVIRNEDIRAQELIHNFGIALQTNNIWVTTTTRIWVA